MAKQKREVIDTYEIHNLLATRFAAPEWALLHEVRNATGYRRTTRTADAVALNLWPSRGLELYGFEVKASRGDLVKELRNPEKAQEIMQYCDRWYLVLGHKDLIQPGELPPTWGLMIAQKNRLVIKTESPKNDAKDLDRGFIASLLRNYTECYVPQSMVDDMVKAKFDEWTEGNKAGRDYELKQAKDLMDSVKTFEEASGVNIQHRWHGENVGEAVRMVLHGDFGKSKATLKRLAEQAQRIVDQTKQELEVIEKVEELQNDRSD